MVKSSTISERDINHKDKQNFDSVLHIMDSAHLLSTIPEAKSTFVYVNIMASTVDSYLDMSLSPLERVEKAWYANFFVRYWREWVLLSERHTLKQNFLTSNTYQCIELNAHALLTFLMNARDNVNKDDVVFFPWLLGSQSCEKTFRSARSMSTVFSSVLNFSILGFLRWLHRLNIQAMLQLDAEKSGIRFPRAEKHIAKSGTKSYVAPSVANITNQDISVTVENALGKAKETLTNLNTDQLLKKHSKWDHVKRSSVDAESEGDDSDDDSDGDNDQEEDSESVAKQDEVESAIIQEVCEDDPVDIEKDLQSISQHGIADSKTSEKLDKCKKSLAPVKLNSSMPCYAFTNTNADKTGRKISPFVEISENGQSISIRKTTAIWLLQENEKLSSYRPIRVRDKQPFASSSYPLMAVSGEIPVIASTLTVNNLCIFKLAFDWELGRVLQFARCDTDTKVYSKPYKEQSVEVGTKNVGVLCTWYKHVKDSFGTFELTQSSEVEYKPLESYVCTLPEDCIPMKNGSTCSNNDILPKKQSSLTSMNFSINDRCNESVQVMVEDYKASNSHQSTTKKSNSTDTKSSPVLIPDDSEVSLAIAKDCWVKCGGIQLNRRDLQRLTSGKELSDLHINAFQNVLKKQFSSIGGLQSTLLQQNKSCLSNKKKTTYKSSTYPSVLLLNTGLC